MYDQINSNFLKVIGLEINISPLSNEKVDRTKPLFFGVSSDVGSSDAVPFTLLSFNLLLIMLVYWLTSKLNKSSAVRTVVSSEYRGMIYGQVVNVMIQLTLPWTFLLFCLNSYSYKGKFNSLCYLFLFFISLIFPFIHLFELLREREKEL